MEETACPVWRPEQDRARPLGAGLEMALILLLFFLYAGQTPPAVNEAHYLAKARHAWEPSWCARDFFLNSPDAHSVFVWLVGWLTLFLSLPTVAWVARVVTWLALAIGWQRLSQATIARPGASILSAGLWLALMDGTAMAGEWVVGGAEAKCLSYAAVFMGLESFLRDRWNRGWIWLGVATSLHVLVGGWSLVAGAAAWISCGAYRPTWRSQLPGALVGLLCAIPGLWPALSLTMGTDPEVVSESAWIYVYGRLSHHLVFHRLSPVEIGSHMALIAAWVLLGVVTPCDMRPGRLGQRPLRGFVGGAIALAIVGALIDQLFLGNWELSASLLRYYWFRLSDAMTPAGVSLAAVAAVARWWESRPWIARTLAVLAVSWSVMNLAWGASSHGVAAPAGVDPQWQSLTRWGQVDPRDLPRMSDEWREVCGWIRQNTPPDTLWITPRQQQTFRWYAERAEVVNVKDIPQDAASVVTWQLRREALYSPETGRLGLTGLGERRLVELARVYGADYILVDEWQGKRRLDLPVAYPPPDREAWFRAYRIPEEEHP